MRKRALALLLAAVLGLVQGAWAAEANDGLTRGDGSWSVTFTPDKQMDSSFRSSQMDDIIRGMQPGDEVVLQVALSNAYNGTTDWYLENQVLQSLEDNSRNSATHGGAYAYRLSYWDKDGVESALFDSDTVGGENISQAGEGLNAATNALDEFFYLDSLEQGQGGHVELRVALDGETQGNDYQDTLAELQLRFAVELPPETERPTQPTEQTPTQPTEQTPTQPTEQTPSQPGTPGTPGTPTERTPGTTTTLTRHAVRTGDDANLLPYYAAMGVSGLVLLGLAIYSWKKSKKGKKK